MKYYLILSLAFLQSIPSDCNTIGKSSNTSKFKLAQTTKLHCKKFKCPPVEDMVCVRMRSKKIGSKRNDIFLLLVNKCEMEYMKCHEGYQAAEVPMKNCGYHDKLGHSGKRRKRSVKKGFRKPIKRDSSGLNDTAKPGEIDTDSLPLDMNNEENKPDNVVSERAPGYADGAEPGKANIYELSNVGIKSDPKPNINEADEKPDEPAEIVNADDQIYLEDKDYEQIEKEIKGHDDDAEPNVDGGQDDSEKPTEAYETTPADTQVIDYPNNDAGDKNKVDAEVPDDYDLDPANKGVDFEEYEVDCPSKCPAREVMICGRCQDGIYRTFMSVCHLRMFTCDHPEENIELVSRHPCVLSAPYLAEADSPTGRVAQPGDVDEVLKFIRCRENAELGRDDPKCNVYNEDKKRKQLRN